MPTCNKPTIDADELLARVGRADAPLLLDVRRRPAFEAGPRVIAASRWRDPGGVAEWAAEVPAGSEVVVACVHGHQVSHAVASVLRTRGVHARSLAGGVEGWLQAGGPALHRAALPGARVGGGTRWVTRARPKIDRLACPWLVRRFIDPAAEFHYVPAEWVPAAALELDAEPYDVPGVAFTHDGDRCSFDAFLARFGLAAPGLARLADIVRAADTGQPELAPQAAGLLAVSHGISALHDDDLAALAHALPVYDALYAGCRAADAAQARPLADVAA